LKTITIHSCIADRTRSEGFEVAILHYRGPIEAMICQGLSQPAA
jgi:hypothetical protein